MTLISLFAALGNGLTYILIVLQICFFEQGVIKRVRVNGDGKDGRKNWLKGGKFIHLIFL
jgi:hypothetical protein